MVSFKEALHQVLLEHYTMPVGTDKGTLFQVVITGLQSV